MKIMSRAEARALGLQKYFLGTQCPHEHIFERYVATGRCVRCCRDAANSNKEKEARKTRYAAKQEAMREASRRRNKKYRIANRDAIRLLKRKNSEKYRAAYREKLRAADRLRYLNKTDDFRVKRRNRRAKRRGADGRHTASDIDDIRRLQGNRCARCRESLRHKQTNVDHIIPLVLGGSNNRTNIQLLCSGCNRQKGAKHPMDDARQLGLLL